MNTTCPACNGSGKLDMGDPIENAYAEYQVATSPLLAAFTRWYAKRHPEELSDKCRTCSGSGTVTAGQKAAHASSSRRDALLFTGLVAFLLVLLALAALWTRHQFAIYG